MAKTLKDTPQYMQFAYGAQPSPLAGAQLIFLNELIEILDEFKTVTREHARAQDLGPEFDKLAAEFRQVAAQLSADIKASRPKAPSMAGVTTQLKKLVKQSEQYAAGAGKERAGHAAQILESNQAIIAALQKIARPREWTFEINRDSLHGHIVSVTATSNIKQGE